MHELGYWLARIVNTMAVDFAIEEVAAITFYKVGGSRISTISRFSLTSNPTLFRDNSELFWGTI